MESPGTTGPSNTLLVLQLKSLVAYKSNDEYLYAMKEDLAEWFMCLYQLDITVDNFFEILETGVILCEHANKVKGYADEQRQLGRLAVIQSNFVRRLEIPLYEVPYRKEVKPQTFHARDNISNFITWTKDLGIPDVLSFETDDLVLRKNEKSVVLCLLEIARIGAKLGMLAPTLVQMEEEIDAEIESGEPPPQIITCDIKSLDEMVKWLAGRCTCPVQFPIVKVGEGKYKIGDSQTLVFVRILRNHVMIRVGGGWDTLEHYLDKHDPCRCGFSGHRNTPIPQSQRPQGTPTRRASTPSVSQTLPTKSPRKISVGPVSHSISESSERTHSPAPRMRSASPGPSPGKLNIQSVSQNYGTKPPVSPLSPTTGNVNSPGFSGQRTNTVLANSRRSQSPAPVSCLRSPSPVSGINKALQPREQTSKVPRPASPSKRCPSPSPSARSASPGPKRCTSPFFQRAVSMSPAPSRKNSQATLVSNYSRSKSIPNTPRPDRRQLPTRPSMDSEGNDSVGTDDTSGSNSMQPSVDINQISTMTLDEFKNLLNSALSVPNGNASEGSLESPRSQSSTDSSRNISSYGASRGGKKPPISEKPSRYKFIGNTSRSLDTKSFKDQPASNGYFEMEKPKRTILASSTVSRPKTPVSNSVSRPKTPVSSSGQRPKTPVSSVQRPKTPVSSNTVQRPKTPVSSIQRPKTPVSSVSRPKTTPASSVQPGSVQNVSRPKTPTSSYATPRPTLNTRTLQTNEIKTVKPHTKLHESKSDSVLSERERPVQNVKPNVSYVCISSEEPKAPSPGEFKGTETYTLSNDSVDSSSDFNGTSSTSMTRSITDPGPERVPQSTQDVPKSNTNDSLIASFNALQKSIQELRNRAQQACIAVENNKKLESKPDETSKIESTNVVVTSSSSQPTNESNTIKRPATPTGRPSTPSLIPRPMTPVGSTSKSLSLTQTIEPVQQETTRQERPPTPKKATILAKSPSANKLTANTPKKITSYSAIHAQRRSTTPGPNELSQIKKDDSGAEIPRSKTPGPGNRTTNSQLKSYVSPIRRLTQSQQQTSTFTAREIPESDYNTPRDQRSVSASPATPRRSSITGLKAKPVVKQDFSEETIMVTVNRDSGRHKINVKDGEETKYKTSKTNTGRIIARAQTPTNQRASTESLDRSRTAKPAAEPRYRPRPRSVDPENWNRGANKEEEVLRVKRKDTGSHVVLNRTEAWVESAAKTVSAGKTPSKNKIPSGILRRSKTPNPCDLDQYNMESRPLEEIKAALTLPVNGLRDIAADDLEAPPEDPEMYETMEKLFQKMRERELKASVNETPGGDIMGDIDVNCMENEDNFGSDEMSLDSNENIKRRGNSPASKPSSHQSPASSARGSVPSTPRSKTPSFSRSSSSSQPINRPVSTPPRPSTPTRSSVNSSRRSSMKSSNGSVPESPTTASVDHAVIIVSKIKEILKTNPRKDNKEGPRSRIPAPKSLSASGKSRSFSNLFNVGTSESSYQKENLPSHKYMNGNANGEYYDDDMDEISGITARAEQNDQTENVRSQSGTKTPVPKLATPLTTGRTAVLNRETSTDKSNRLVRAVSISSLSSSSNTLSCTYGEEEEFV